MNKTGLISAVAERTGMTKKDADAAVCAVFDIITDALREEEKVQIDKMLGHGGFFLTKGVGQRVMAAAMQTPVFVMETAGEGGAWGIALLASYLINKKDGEDLADFLDENVFKGNEGSTLAPEAEGVKGFNAFMDRYMKGLGIERAAVESEIW